jgi:hypothetical protein
MVVLDFTIVNIALPSMERDFGVATSVVQWVVTGYAIAFSGLLILGGRAADMSETPLGSWASGWGGAGGGSGAGLTHHGRHRRAGGGRVTRHAASGDERGGEGSRRRDPATDEHPQVGVPAAHGRLGRPRRGPRVTPGVAAVLAGRPLWLALRPSLRNCAVRLDARRPAVGVPDPASLVTAGARPVMHPPHPRLAQSVT